jgi:hypothetical protein
LKTIVRRSPNLRRHRNLEATDLLAVLGFAEGSATITGASAAPSMLAALANLVGADSGDLVLGVAQPATKGRPLLDGRRVGPLTGDQNLGGRQRGDRMVQPVDDGVLPNVNGLRMTDQIGRRRTTASDLARVQHPPRTVGL